MNAERVKDIFERYFAKYKKTEGDSTVWSAYWVVYQPGHSFEINMTRCPRGTRFKVFADKRKITEIEGWDAFLDSLDALEQAHAPVFERTDFFTQMEEML
ncbi:hypothetical protein MASR1M90_12170 [Desulfovibrionales bacterium]